MIGRDIQNRDGRDIQNWFTDIRDFPGQVIGDLEKGVIITVGIGALLVIGVSLINSRRQQQ